MQHLCYSSYSRHGFIPCHLYQCRCDQFERSPHFPYMTERQDRVDYLAGCWIGLGMGDGDPPSTSDDAFSSREV